MALRRSTCTTILVLGAFLLVADAEACTCIWMGTVDSQTRYQWQKSSEIFSARITRIDDSPDESEASAELEVLEVWKGSMPGGGHIIVAVAPKKGGMSCAYRAVVGQELIVYSSLSPPRSLSSCAISTLSDRSREKRLLDKWRKRDAKNASRRISESPNPSLERTREGKLPSSYAGMAASLPKEFARAEAVQKARAIVAGELGVLEGCILLASLAHDLVPDWRTDPDFVVFGAVASKIDDLPFRSVRDKWSCVALGKADQRIERYTQESKAQVLEACHNIVNRFAALSPHDGAV